MCTVINYIKNKTDIYLNHMFPACSIYVTSGYCTDPLKGHFLMIIIKHRYIPHNY